MNRALPTFLDALQKDESLAAELGIRWLDEEERGLLHRSALGVLRGAAVDERWRARGLERLERSLPLALGPERHKRVLKASSSTALFHDPERPGHVLLSLAASMSPLTWAEAPATPEGLRALFARYFVEAGPVVALPRVFRSVANFGDADRGVLEEALTRGHPMIDDAVWYCAHVEDPWLGVEDRGGLSLTIQMREVQRDHGGRFPSVSARTLFSRSALTLEQHPFGLWVVELRYAPAPDAAAVRWVNEIFRSHFPEDLPVDLIGSNVLQGGHTAAIELDEQEARGEIDRFLIAARLALAPCEPGTTRRLRGYVERFADDGETLGFLATVASSYDDQEILGEIALRAAGSEMAESILGHLQPKGAESEPNPDPAPLPNPDPSRLPNPDREGGDSDQDEDGNDDSDAEDDV
jgi:hypothetical protein